jgi:hypothetical protein
VRKLQRDDYSTLALRYRVRYALSDAKALAGTSIKYALTHQG